MDEINALFQAAASESRGYGHSDWSVVTWDPPVVVKQEPEVTDDFEPMVMELPPVDDYQEDMDMAAELETQHDLDVWESDEDQAAGYHTDPEWYD